MELIKTGKWVYSQYGEWFDSDEFDTEDEAIKACINDYGHGFVGEMVTVKFEASDLHLDIEYELLDVLEENVGEAAETWELSGEYEKELSIRMGNAMVDYLNENNLQPKCYKVIRIKEVGGYTND